jgi:DNA-binding transcriptional ArsR family regulator
MVASQPKPAAHTAVEVLPESVPVTMPDLPPTFTITTEQQLKALGDATRTRILSIIQNQPATAKQIADNLGVTPGTIGHHLQVLEEAGLAQVVARRLVHGITAKYYTRTARIFDFDLPDVMGGKPRAVEFLELARDEIDKAYSERDEVVVTSALPHVRLSPERALEYERRLRALVDDLILEKPDPDGEVFGMIVAMFRAPEYMQRVATPPVGKAGRRRTARGTEQT